MENQPDKIVHADAPAYLDLRYGDFVVDNLLEEATEKMPHLVDLLLDFKHTIGLRVDADETVRLFCDLRRELEDLYYLRLYRLRRWLEGQLMAEISGVRGDRVLMRPVALRQRTHPELLQAIKEQATEQKLLPPGHAILRVRLQFFSLVFSFGNTLEIMK